MIVYDGMSFPYSDDGCTSNADSEVGKLQAMLGPNVPVYGSPHFAYELVSMMYEEDVALCTSIFWYDVTFSHVSISIKLEFDEHMSI